MQLVGVLKGTSLLRLISLDGNMSFAAFLLSQLFLILKATNAVQI